MKKRGKRGQEKHDSKVIKELDRLRGGGYRVWADLPGRAKPPKVGGVIPDIYARKGKDLVIEEIETPSTLQKDKPQQEKLRKGAKEKGGTFRTLLAK